MCFVEADIPKTPAGSMTPNRNNDLRFNIGQLLQQFRFIALQVACIVVYILPLPYLVDVCAIRLVKIGKVITIKPSAHLVPGLADEGPTLQVFRRAGSFA